MKAVCKAYDINIDGKQQALLCQKVENLVVGAPCGVMDQMTSSIGKQNNLLVLRCQPAEILANMKIPPNVRFWGMDSGVCHAIEGQDYSSVRVGTFMGLAMVSKYNNCTKDLPFRKGYLANISPSEFHLELQHILPKRIMGNNFLQEYGEYYIDHEVTQINYNLEYSVRIPTQHPIMENFRVQGYQFILQDRQNLSVEQLSYLGELMYQSHVSYSECGLGSSATDLIVDLVKQKQNSQKGLYGAKISGGGSGGTVCILGDDSIQAKEAISDICKEFESATGHKPVLFRSSSSGAEDFGCMLVNFSKE
eukprot:TRINITY_DN6520_c0_g2_i1.p1 TRINITY_DN6520_c0_g2~~TRINITY_DN6520_c0_g2_i1.p1  ORF type:complete len:307 (+),score=19.82 TRINITY_DN6520_c0_g2_i1:375-1295(+)